MSLINNKNWHHSRVLKSLLLIITLQLVVLQVKALSMPHAINQKPCSEMTTNMAEHAHKSGSVLPNEEQADSCTHCENSDLDCYNSCHTASLLTLVFEIIPDLKNMDTFLYLASNKTLIAISLRPAFKPPRLLIV